MGVVGRIILKYVGVNWIKLRIESNDEIFCHSDEQPDWAFRDQVNNYQLPDKDCTVEFYLINLKRLLSGRRYRGRTEQRSESPVTNTS